MEIVEQHDGSKIALRKLNAEYDIHNKLAAMNFLLNHAAEGQIVTGLLYVDSDPDDLHGNLVDRRGAAQCARREGAVPGLRDAGQVQRELAVSRQGGQSEASTTECRVTKERGTEREVILRDARCARPQDEAFSHGLSATAFFTASTMPSGGSIFTSSGLPVSSTLLRLDRIAGQPARPPARIVVRHVPPSAIRSW